MWPLLWNESTGGSAGTREGAVAGRWIPPGKRPDAHSWAFDVSKGWAPPGSTHDPGGTQYQMSPGDMPSATGQPDWSMLVSHPGSPAPTDLVNYTPDTGEFSPPGVQAPVGNMNLSMQPNSAATAPLRKLQTPGAKPQQDAARLAAMMGGGGMGLGAGGDVGVGANRAFPYADPGQPPASGGGPFPGSREPAQAPAPQQAPGQAQGGQGGGVVPGTNQPISGGYPEAGALIDVQESPDGGAIYLYADGNGGVKPVHVGPPPAGAQGAHPGNTVLQPGETLVDPSGRRVAGVGPEPEKNPYQSAGEGHIINTQTGAITEGYTPYHAPQTPQAGIDNGYGYAFDPATGKFTTQDLGIPQPKQDISTGRHHAFFDPNAPDKPYSTYDFPEDPTMSVIGDSLVRYDPSDNKADAVYSAPRYAIPDVYSKAMGSQGEPSWYNSPLGQGGDTRYTNLSDSGEPDPLHGALPKQIDGFGQNDPNDPRIAHPDDASYMQSASIPNYRPGTQEQYQGADFGPYDVSGQRPGRYGPSSPAPHDYGVGGDIGVGADPNALQPGEITPPVAPPDVVGTGHKFGEQVSMEGTHKGTDLQAYEGTPALSPVDGTVSAIQMEPEGLGLRVIIQDSSGRSHSLNHLSEAYVEVGEPVREGDPVASVGSSGAGSTGAHLDYRVENPDGSFANPEPALGGLARMARADDGAEPGAPPVGGPPTGMGQDPTGGFDPGDWWEGADQTDRYTTGQDADINGGVLGPNHQIRVMRPYDPARDMLPNRFRLGTGADMNPNDPWTSQQPSALAPEPTPPPGFVQDQLGALGQGGDSWTPPVGVGSSDIAWKQKREHYVKSHGGDREKIKADMGMNDAEFNKEFKRGKFSKEKRGKKGRPTSYLKTAGHLGADDASTGDSAGVLPNMQLTTNSDGTASWVDPKTGQAIDFGSFGSTGSTGSSDGSGGSSGSNPYGTQGSTADPIDWAKEYDSRQYQQGLLQYYQDQIKNQAQQLTNDYNLGIQKLQQDYKISGDQIAYQKGKDALDAKLQHEGQALQLQMQGIQNKFQGGQNTLDRQEQTSLGNLSSWTQLAQTAYSNPWLQQLQGRAPNAAMSSGGGAAPNWFNNSLASAGGSSSMGQAMGGKPSSSTPSFSDWQNTDPFARAAVRTNAELSGPGGWQNMSQQMRDAWASSGGPKTTPDTTRLQSSRMTDLDKIGQDQMANTFGDTADSYWGQQAKDWSAGNASGVYQQAKQSGSGSFL